MIQSPAAEQQTEPMSQGQMQMLSMPTIASQLPIRYANGHVLERFEGSCCICSNPINPANLHGSIIQPFKSVAIIQAIGVCRSCKIGVPFHMRVRDDGTTDWRDAKGAWVRGAATITRKETTRRHQRLLVLASLSILLSYIALHIK